MSLWIRCMAPDHEDLSLDPTSHVKKPAVVMYACNPRAEEAETQESLGTAAWLE